jgi:hypothetical protein
VTVRNQSDITVDVTMPRRVSLPRVVWLSLTFGCILMIISVLAAGGSTLWRAAFERDAGYTELMHGMLYVLVHVAFYIAIFWIIHALILLAMWRTVRRLRPRDIVVASAQAAVATWAVSQLAQLLLAYSALADDPSGVGIVSAIVILLVVGTVAATVIAVRMRWKNLDARDYPEPSPTQTNPQNPF